MNYDGDDYFFHKNHLGSITEITDIYQNTVRTYDYDAFGAILAESGSLDHNAFTYTARKYHPRSGLYYYRARFYDPRTGRFITPDPIGHLGGVNLYAYVGNAPVDYIDPYGLDWLDNAANFSAGFGDFITGGLTNQFREQLGLNDNVNECSKSYEVGEWTGFVWDVAFFTAFALEAVPMATQAAEQMVFYVNKVPYGIEVTVGTVTRLVPTYKYQLHPANHTFEYIGKVRHIQINWFYRGISGTGGTLSRIPLPWR